MEEVLRMLIRMFLGALLLLSALAVSGGEDTKAYSQLINCRSDMVAPDAGRNMKVELRLVEARTNMWEFEVRAANEGPAAMFIMVDPSRSDRSKGFYFNLGESDPSVLRVSSQLYYPPNPSLYVDYTGVKLIRLDANATYTGRIAIKFPLKETVPPYNESLERRTMDQTKVKFVEASIGFLPDEEGIRSLIQAKEAVKHLKDGPLFHGLDSPIIGAFKDKCLYSLQVVVHSPRVKLKD
jgi:hypothetical protein